MLTMTTEHTGLVRARPSYSSPVAMSPMPKYWHVGSVAAACSGTTDLFAIDAVMAADLGTTIGTAGARKQTINRPARLLDMRST